MYAIRRPINKRLLEKLSRTIFGIQESPALGDLVLEQARQSLERHGDYIVPEYLAEGLPWQARYVSDDTLDTFLDLKQVAERLGVSSKTARRWLPEPDATIGTKAVGWRVSTIQRTMAKRN